MFDNTAAYNHEMRQAGKIKFLCIEDLNRSGRSVTNDVEKVLAELAKEYGALPAWIIYRDSDGNWDRIMATPEGKFIGFSVIEAGHRPKTMGHALQLILDIEG